jgi:alkane 1-monooxygenase
MKSIKYLTVWTLPAISFYSIHQTGWQTFLPLFYAFGFIPLVELIIKPDPSNISKQQEEQYLQDRSFDVIVYLSGLTHLIFLFYFLKAGISTDDTTLSYIGKTISLGLMCGIFGINIAHELGHRKNKAAQFFSRMLLLSSLYMHFIIEHNRGHHKYVSTDEDPASAPRKMALYRFWVRSVIGSFISAWKIENKRVKKKRLPIWKNEMIWFQIIQIGFLMGIYFLFGPLKFLVFLMAAFIGILLLETVNYVEHYGLRRKKLADGNYERAMPRHSWNSNHLMGRLMLFELSRHSDHHYLASRKYQILRNHDESPQLPTGYPGMMILSFIPPLWYAVVHKRLDEFQNIHPIEN